MSDTAAPLEWDNPYPTVRRPTLARNVVSTSQPLAAQAGLRMLLAGGNAVDAALATAIALAVVEPISNGIGSDAFAIVWDGKSLHGLNASGRSPAGWSADYFASHKTMPTRGWNSVSVPGAVSAWVALSKRFGKLEFAKLFEPAIEYAANGYLVSPFVASRWAQQVAEMREQPGFAAGFMPNGRAPHPGELFKFPDQARSLELIASSRGEAFYHGALAEKMVAHSESCGGVLTRADLSGHTLDWVGAIEQNYRDLTVHEIPPNGQGIVCLIALGILQHFDLASLAVDGPDSLHLQIEAVKLAFADAQAYVADAEHMTQTKAHALLDPAYLKSRAALIDRTRAPRFLSRQAAGLGHRLSHRRRCKRHDGVDDSIQLHGLRLRCSSARHRHQLAESRLGFRAEVRPSESSRCAQAPLSHHHSRLHHPQRRAVDELRSDGRHHAAAGPYPDDRAHGRLRTKPASRDRWPALSRGARHGREFRAELRTLHHR